MGITDILIFALAAPLVMWGLPASWRTWAIFCGSLLGLGWLQYRGAGGDFSAAFEISTLTVGLTVAVWWIIQPSAIAEETQKQNQQTLLASSGLLGLIWLGVSVASGEVSLFSPVFALIFLVAGAFGAIRFLPERQTQPETMGRIATLLIMLIVGLLAVLKTNALARFLGTSFNVQVQGEIVPLAWLGISYVAFRLIGLLRDYQYGRLPEEGYSLRDVMAYVLFLPAYTAGPIDRAQRFIPEYRAAHALDSSRLVDGTMRIAIGVLKKFVVADSIAVVAMNPTLIERTDSVIGIWFILYVYALQIYLDFSGYSDVAIGIGKLYGLTLPENFDRPYFAPNIQQFWNRWHMTLSVWFRGYYFTPLSRALIRRKLPRYTDVLIAQITTMVLIGLWHGVTVNFVLWGLWHGVGLFAFKVISDYTRMWHRNVTQNIWIKRALFSGSVFLTFHFVAIGWVFFALPNVDQSLEMLSRLVGA